MAEGNTPVNVHSTTINHQEIFLVDGNGKERVLRLRNMNLAGREGHELAVVQVSRDGAGEPDVVTIQNRTLNETYYNDSFFTKMFMPSVMWWILTPMAMLVAAWLLPTVLGVLVIVALPVYVFRRFRKGRQAIKAVKASGQFLPG